jgi:hypothetical protein
VCLDTLDKCASGARLLKITYTNGSPRAYSNDVNAVWAGFGDSTFSFAGYDAELNVRVALPTSSLPSPTPNNLRPGLGPVTRLWAVETTSPWMTLSAAPTSTVAR